MGEKLEEIPPHHKMAETAQVPTKDKAGLCSFLGHPTTALTALAKRKRKSTFRVQHQCATLAPPQLQRLLHSIKHTPLMAAQAKGRVNY